MTLQSTDRLAPLMERTEMSDSVHFVTLIDMRIAAFFVRLFIAEQHCDIAIIIHR